MIKVRFLGTSAARPTVRRNPAAIAVQRQGESVLLDCAEGTQRQIMRYGTGFSFSHIFVTHGHADHFLGLPGLLRTMNLEGREKPLTVYGPRAVAELLRAAVELGVERLRFPVGVRGLRPGDRVDFAGWSMHAYSADHRVPALGYALVEEMRLGRFDVDVARSLGVPAGPLFGRLHRGEAVEVDGRTVTPDQVVGPPRPGRKVVYTGDTRPSRATEVIAMGADLLIHEATFSAEERKRARETGHSTAAEAARVALRARVRRLALTHLSARYSDSPGLIERQARAIFPGAIAARDGLEIELGYRG